LVAVRTETSLVAGVAFVVVAICLPFDCGFTLGLQIEVKQSFLFVSSLFPKIFFRVFAHLEKMKTPAKVW
jgi:hypothetical protein